MNSFKRLTAIVLAILIFALTLPTVSVFAADDDMRYGRTKLSGNLQKLYDKLVVCYSNDTPTEIDIDEGWKITAEQLHYTFKLFYSDYPEYFWIINGGYGWAALGDTVVSFKPSYSFSNVASAKSAYNAKVAELTQGLNGKSDYEKSKILHDRLAENVDYTFTANDQNAYGALVEGKAVCNGYSRAYQHLMNEVGITTWYVSGNSINPSTGTAVGHAWNIVKIDGKWYYTDVTWDDQGDKVFHEYLNITTDKMAEGHQLDSDYESLVPKATATAANYYKLEGREFTKYDESRLIELLKKDNNQTQIYVDGNIESFINSVNGDLLSIGKDLGGKGAFKISSSYSILKNAMFIKVILISENHVHKTKTTVKQENATCLSNGTKAHYICDCGLRFFDSACTKQISSDSELVIPAKAHTPSGWKNDATCHWKECTVCGSDIANTRGNFTDNNHDDTCDKCGYSLPKPDESGNIVVSGNSNTTSSSNSATTPSTPTASDTTDDNLDDGNNDVSSDDTASDDEEDTTVENVTSEIIEIIEEEDTDSSGLGTTAWIIIIVAAIVIASGTVFIIMYFKK